MGAKSIALGIAGVYYIYPPCYAICCYSMLYSSYTTMGLAWRFRLGIAPYSKSAIYSTFLHNVRVIVLFWLVRKSMAFRLNVVLVHLFLPLTLLRENVSFLPCLTRAVTTPIFSSTKGGTLPMLLSVFSGACLPLAITLPHGGLVLE